MNDSPETAGQPAGVSRRRLLGSGAAVAGVAAASLALPPNVRTALASSRPRNGSLQSIKHVVMLMQENRSFDHYYGTLSGVRGFGDPTAMRISNHRSVFFQPDPSNPDGFLLPYRLNSKITAAQAIPSMSHEWVVQHQAWNGGAMDNWVPAHMASDGATDGQYTMGYFTRDDIPFQFALAEAFTILDGYHCSVLGPTAPNRHMWMSGTIDPDGLAGGPSLTTSGPSNQFTWTTYMERLQAAGISWKIYRQPGNLTGAAAISKWTQFGTAQPGNPLFDNGVATQPLGQFEYDAMNDQLPTVSWILPPAGFDEHPAALPAAGATFVAGKIDAIAANPEVWAKTAFILSYDENDGMFDHVLPLTPPAGTPGEFVFKTSNTGVDGGGLPVGLGFRVPCIIVSPWTTGGYVFSERSDHTSQLRLLERLTGVVESNISDWRRANVGDLTGAFRFDDANDAPPLPDTNGQYNLAQFEVSQFPLPSIPGAQQSVPRQEPGRRPHVG
jgi:phospholipase C